MCSEDFGEALQYSILLFCSQSPFYSSRVKPFDTKKFAHALDCWTCVITSVCGVWFGRTEGYSFYLFAGVVVTLWSGLRGEMNTHDKEKKLTLDSRLDLGFGFGFWA